MTAPTDQFVDIANRGQEAVTTAVRTWTDTVQGFAGTLSTSQSQVPDLSSVVEQYFDFAEKALANHRELAQQWASAAAKASEAVTQQAQHATPPIAEHTATGTEAVVDNADATTRAAGDETASTLRAARTP